jgi:hypothetical protein
MKMSIILSCFVSLLLGIFISCQNSELTDPPQTSKYLPNKTGDSWTYKVTQNTGDTTNSAIVKISNIGTTQLKDGTNAAIWLSEWPQNTHPAAFKMGRDTTFVISSGDTLMVSSSVFPKKYPPKSFNELPIQFKYEFPLNIGKTWHHGVDSSKVFSKDAISVPKGTFDNVYKIHITGFSLNYRYNADIWFKSGIGIIKVDQYSKGLTLYGFNKQWKLVDYHLN